MNRPKVTVLINTINEEPERLENAILSYKNQDVDVQILISTVKDDVSIGIGERLGCDVVINPGKGIYEQLNNAVNHIKGDWWCYASGHDFALPDKLLNEVTCCINSGKKICYSDYILFYPESKNKKTVTFFPYDYHTHLTKGNFVNDCAMINTEMSKKYLPFRNELWGNDSHYDFWLRVFEGEGNVFCHNNVPTWVYIQYEDSKHIVRQKSKEELEEYRLLRSRMLSTHSVQPVISVGLPVYRSKIVWLAMEGLCRQKTDIPWELIICEDEAGANGEEYYNKYKTRLSLAGCISVKYVSIENNDPLRDRMALSLKWRCLIANTAPDSVGFVLQAADDYSEPRRIQSAHEQFSKGYDWLQARYGLFYHIYKGKTILFDLNTVPQPNTGLSLAIRLSIARELPEEAKYSSVDNWMYNAMFAIKPDAKVYCDESNNYLYGVFTDGENIISKGRENNYDNIKFPFMKTIKRVRDYLPVDIFNRLADKERIMQAAVSRSVYFFEDKLFDKFGFINRRTDKGNAFIINKDKPMVMFGCYNEPDFKLVLAHKSDVVIIWAGSDSMSYNYDRMKDFVGKSNIHHISGSKFISTDLDAVGLEYTYYPISLCNHDELRAKPLGDKIYVYIARGKNDPEFYGKSIYDKLILHYGADKFILANADTYSKEEVYKLYEECFIGLRLVKHDGLSETVAELGLMGRNVVYNGDTPNSLNYRDIDDIISHIDNESKKAGYVDYKLAERMTDFLNCGTDWLYVKNKRSGKKACSYSETQSANKLGIAYSVFDDLDHLRQSLLSVRDNADYIIITYQNVSYTGRQASFNIYAELCKLRKEGLIDNIQEYKPDFKLTTKGNEIRKRNLGLSICKDHYCTHYITMDCDEVFIPKQFKEAKQIVYDYNYKASFIFSQTYYKDRHHVISPPEKFHIPFIYKIIDESKFKLDAKIEGIVADKSRKMTDIGNDLIIFERDFIELHHLSYVRDDIVNKLKNKASGLSEERITKIVDSYNRFSEFKINQDVYTENGVFNVKRILISAI